MKIKEMFKDDIDRTINGVVQVEQEKEDVIKQEVKEYVVTSELKKHFTNFFNDYSKSFDTPTDNVGVWITGFFGSGKSHFLKMLSYLLENKEIDGKKTVDYFEEKFDDPLTFMNVQTSVQVPTETILFNIDVEGSMFKDDTAVLKVFAQVFFNHLGFFGSDLKLAKLEQFISKQGKMDAFKEAYEEIHEESWIDSRAEYTFFEEDVIDALVQANVMNETTAQHWFDGSETADYSISQLVEEVKAYVDSKPEGFRLLFMIDEVGQYVGTNTSMLLNLQNIIEKLGSVCRGQVWVVATGQEALDDMIKLRTDEFSRIMARFPIRLSLTSSSVGEVIEKRLLTKTDQARTILEGVYENNENVLSNLYAFDTELKDLKGYCSEDEFVRIFPFVPYQFIIMQKVFNKIREHGHAGKHQSSGERSMLNGFQESAQRIENKNELTLVPMYAFYDTLHSFLDTTVRSVIERAERAASNQEGLLEEDVNLLKLLYLILYIDDIQSNIENLTILMADTITVDKLVLRQQVIDSLKRLEKQNYIARNGDVYSFLTDEEQDIAREISHQNVPAAEVIHKISAIIFDDIYDKKKYRYTHGNAVFDFDFDKSVDGQNYGNTSGGMKLRFVTEAYDAEELKLITDSKRFEAICKLSDDYSVFDGIEKALKIERYCKQKNVSQLAESIQNIIASQQKEARRLLKEAQNQLSEAIVKGKFYIDGDTLSFPGTSVKTVLDKALETLVEHTYSKMNLINRHATSESDIRSILNGTETSLEGMEANQEACEDVYRYLEKNALQKLPTSMSDIQERYQKIPYGWKELDVAQVIAQLFHNQKITIKRSGHIVQANAYQFVDYLRKKNEIYGTNISIREHISASKMKRVKNILKEYFDVMDIPSDEDGLIAYIIKQFNEYKAHLDSLNHQNDSIIHPGSQEIKKALGFVQQVLLSQSDPIALVDTICDLEDDLLDSKEDMEDVQNFYKTQRSVYDSALKIKEDVWNEKDYLLSNPAIKDSFDKIKEITTISNNFQYNRISSLNEYISTILDQRNQIVDKKKKELMELIDSCLHEVSLKAENQEKLKAVYEQAKQSFETKKEEINKLNSILALEAKKTPITSLKDNTIYVMDEILNQKDKPKDPVKPLKTKKVRQIQRAVIFNTAHLSNEEDINRYVQNIRSKLLSYLNEDDEIQIK